MTDYKQELQDLIVSVFKEGASDLHLSAGHHPTIRVSGDLIPIVKKPVLSAEDTMGLVLEILNEENKKTFFETKEVDFSYNPDQDIRFRGNAYFQKGSVGASFRLIPANVRSLEELGLPPQLADFTEKRQGFFLVVGPIGHGKTTTLAAMLDRINKTRAEHILTIEDPIEYIFKNDRSIVDQREVRFDTLSFGAAVHSMFRQDINVAMIGEMRDPDTIATAVTAAETGHLVFSTLHTNSASQTIDRIIDSFPPTQQNQIRVQLAGSLLGVFSQRLIPRISGGVIPAFELLINTTGCANLIREGRTSEINIIIETGSHEGMVSMNSCLADLVRKGEITTENAYRYSINPKGLDKLLL